MKKGTLVTVRAPNSSRTRQGRVIQRVGTHNGDWLELAAVGDDGKVVKNTAPFRARPSMCTAA